MSAAEISYKLKSASEKEICMHLHRCSENFSEPLAQRVKIEEYAEKIFDKAITFEAWHDKMLIGLVAAYFNESSDGSSGFITNVSVVPDFTGKGIATALMDNCLAYAQKKEIKNIFLEVSAKNDALIRFYKKLGFKKAEIRGNKLLMKR